MMNQQQRVDLLGLINRCLNTDLHEGDIAIDILLLGLAAAATRITDLEAKYESLVPSSELNKV